MALKINYIKFYESIIEELEQEAKRYAKLKNWDKYYKAKERLEVEKNNLKRVIERKHNDKE